MMLGGQNNQPGLPSQNIKKNAPFGLQSNMMNSSKQRTTALSMSSDKDFEVTGKVGNDDKENKTEFYDEIVGRV